MVPMNLKQNCRNDKLSLIAMIKFLQEAAAMAGVKLDEPLAKVCEHAQVNRTQVYERKKHIEDALERVSLPGPGRPVPLQPCGSVSMENIFRVREEVLRYRLEHPDALITHGSDRERTTYSDGFIRFILDLGDQWEDSDASFCKTVEVPYQTFRTWRKKDIERPYEPHVRRLYGSLSEASEDTRMIAEDYSTWGGTLKDFLKYEAARLHLAPAAIRRVLQIFGLLPLRSTKPPRYRGSTERREPGSILVTDGKTVETVSSATGEVRSYNWQGIVDQATTCHTAVVVSDTESAASVRKAFDESCCFFGRPPHALIHDNKPIHNDRDLRTHIEETTRMIPATPNRGENKAGVEGEFGKFEREVGSILLDDSSEESLIKSAVGEVLRAYTAAVNHAARAELDGKSRVGVLREARPDPAKDREFIEQLHADHTGTRRVDALPTRQTSLALLNKAYEHFGIAALDPKGATRQWLAGRYTPEAIRQGVAIFGAERHKGRILNKTADRYLVKVIQNCQEEIDLRLQEEFLRKYAEAERSVWLKGLEEEYQTLVGECQGSSLEKNLAFRLSEKAVFGGLVLQRAFWERKLKTLIKKQADRFTAVRAHVRRLFEATWEHRFALIGKLINWEYQLTN